MTRPPRPCAACALREWTKSLWADRAGVAAGVAASLDGVRGVHIWGAREAAAGGFDDELRRVLGGTRGMACRPKASSVLSVGVYRAVLAAPPPPSVLAVAEAEGRAHGGGGGGRGERRGVARAPCYWKWGRRWGGGAHRPSCRRRRCGRHGRRRRRRRHGARLRGSHPPRRRGGRLLGRRLYALLRRAHCGAAAAGRVGAPRRH